MLSQQKVWKAATLASQLRVVAGWTPPSRPDATVVAPNSDFGSLLDIADMLNKIESAVQSVDAAPTLHLQSALAIQQQAATPAIARYQQLSQPAATLAQAP